MFKKNNNNGIVLGTSKEVVVIHSYGKRCQGITIDHYPEGEHDFLPGDQIIFNTEIKGNVLVAIDLIRFSQVKDGEGIVHYVSPSKTSEGEQCSEITLKGIGFLLGFNSTIKYTGKEKFSKNDRVSFDVVTHSSGGDRYSLDIENPIKIGIGIDPIEKTTSL